MSTDPILPRRSDVFNVSASDIFHERQLAAISRENANRTPNLLFEKVKPDRSIVYRAAEDEDSEQPESVLNDSLIDMYNISIHYNEHPTEHPLEDAKSVSDTKKTSPGQRNEKNPSSEPQSFTSTSAETHEYGSSPRKSSFRALQSSSSTSVLSRLSFGSQKTLTVTVSELFEEFYCFDNSNFLLWEEGMRAYFARNIVIPLAGHINRINAYFARTHKLNHIALGRTNPDEIESVCKFPLDPELVYLPFVLPYLRTDNRQEHLVQRILTWSHNPFLHDYRIVDNSPIDLNTSWPETFPVRKEQPPSDAELVFKLFCCFMDKHLNPFPVTSASKEYKSFSGAYVLQPSKKRLNLKQSNQTYCIEVLSTTPTSYKFHCLVDKQSVASLPETDVFRILVAFIAYTEYSANGYLHAASLSSMGLTLEQLTALGSIRR